MERACRRARLPSKWGRIAFGEALGTFVATLFVSSAGIHDFINENSNVFGTSMASGFAFCFGILICGHLAPLAPLNPTLAFSLVIKGDIAFVHFTAYLLGEFAGALLGQSVVYGLYYDAITTKFAEKFNSSNYRGEDNVLFCSLPQSHTTFAIQILDPVVSVFLLTLGNYAIVDDRNFKVPDPGKPVLVGLLVTAIINAFSLNTGAPLNSAIDVTGRMLSSMTGWGSIVWTAENYFFWIPIAMPLVGATLAAVSYSVIIAPNLPREVEQTEDESKHPLMRNNMYNGDQILLHGSGFEMVTPEPSFSDPDVMA